MTAIGTLGEVQMESDDVVGKRIQSVDQLAALNAERLDDISITCREALIYVSIDTYGAMARIPTETLGGDENMAAVGVASRVTEILERRGRWLRRFGDIRFLPFGFFGIVLVLVTMVRPPLIPAPWRIVFDALGGTLVAAMAAASLSAARLVMGPGGVLLYSRGGRPSWFNRNKDWVIPVATTAFGSLLTLLLTRLI